MIPTYGPAHLISRGDPFVTLARSVVGQQISVKAAQSVWERLVTMCPKLTPAQFLKSGAEQLRYLWPFSPQSRIHHRSGWNISRPGASM